MLSFLEKHRHSFDPETIQVLCKALDDAWQRAQAGRTSFNGEERAARLVLAKCIVDVAEEGERDPQRLVDKALLRFNL